jgi:RecB family exonuclease
MEISYSQINSYMRCPWLFKIVYVDRKRPPLHPSSSLGISIHRALEAFHQGGGGDLAKLLDCHDANWSHAGFSTPQEQMEWHRKGQRILELYFSQEQERRSEIVAVEKDFLFPLDPHVVRGTIDRIDRLPDGEIEVIDYKSHLDMVGEEEAAQNLQLGIYGLGVKESLGLTATYLTLYYVAAGKKVTVEYDPSRDEEICELIVRVADLIVYAKGFKPDTAYCPSCDFKTTCPHSTAKG